jgi:hypothetical protein
LKNIIFLSIKKVDKASGHEVDKKWTKNWYPAWYLKLPTCQFFLVSTQKNLPHSPGNSQKISGNSFSVTTVTFLGQKIQ